MKYYLSKFYKTINEDTYIAEIFGIANEGQLPREVFHIKPATDSWLVMYNSSELPEQNLVRTWISSVINIHLEPVVFHVSKGGIRRFTDAVEDPAPIYRDEEFAMSTKYGGIVSPHGFFGQPVKHSVGMETILGTEAVLNILGTPTSNVFNAGCDAEFFLPVRPGDIIVACPKLADIYEKTGKSGKMLFMAFEVTYKNQDDRIVAIMRHTVIL